VRAGIRFAINLLLVIPYFADASVERCNRLVAGTTHEELLASIQEQAPGLYRPQVIVDANLLTKNGNAWGISQAVQKDLLDLLADFSRPLDQELVGKILRTLEITPEIGLKKAWVQQLTPFFTSDQATSRVKLYLSGEKPLKVALGHLNLTDLHTHVYGGNIEKPTAGSVLGRFFADLKKAGISTPTEMRRFFSAPSGEEVGQEKRLVGLKPEAFEIFKQYFLSPFFLIHTHQPQQGTLNLSFNGQSLSYAGGSNHGDTRLQARGAVWPLIFLDRDESQRADLYFKLGSVSQDLAKAPWNSNGPDGKPFVKGGAYTCCTHWFGEMPIGARPVSTYRFPGQVDKYGRRKVGVDPVVSSIGEEPREVSPLFKMVWGGNGQGYMQLWEMLNLQASLDAAELTNPGYILYALLGKTSNERVPLVFVLVDSDELPSNDQIRQSISPY
jgi:hypothetical protein